MNDELIGSTVSHYRIIELLGGGGMGVVYRAEDLRLRRQVALKFLPTALTDNAEARERFQREAQAASALDHNSICTIHDIDQTASGQLFIAMSLYDGQTLRQRLGAGPLPLAEALDIARHVAAGLERAHEHGIVHRDIKPANLMITAAGEVKILDFGIAKLADRSKLTAAGAMAGTASYMAPEQIDGTAVDARADVWSLGVVLHEMITGANPFSRADLAASAAATLTWDPPAVSSIRPDVPQDLDALIQDALRKDPAQRLQSATRFREAMDDIRSGLQPASASRSRRSLAITAAVAVALVGVAAAITLQARSRAARADALAGLPRIEQLANEGQFAEAYRLATASIRLLGNDSTLNRLLKLVSDVITIDSEPQGALVTLVPLSGGDTAADTIHAGVTPIYGLNLPRDDYFMRMTLAGFVPAERVLSSSLMRAEAAFFADSTRISVRTILGPADGVPADMVYIPGGTYELVSHAAPRGASAQLDPYYIDRFEVTNQQYLEFIRNGGYSNRSLWKYPVARDGRTLEWEQAMSLFVDRTGLPGPRDWIDRQFPEGQTRYPVTGITWYEAAAFAEAAGKTLPTLYQWEKAARNGEITHAEGAIMPWGYEGARSGAQGRANFAGNGTVAVDRYPFGISPFGAYAMAGNVREWTSSDAPGGHLATGGSWRDPAYLFNAIGTYDEAFASSDLGFRCVLIAPGGRLDGAGSIAMADRTPTYEPVDEATFRTLLSHYRYDPGAANVETLEHIQTDDWVREKIAWDSPSGDRVLAYLYLPTAAEPPYQTLVFVPSSRVFTTVTIPEATEWTLAPVIRAGRAILTPVLYGMRERPFDSAPPNDPGSVAFRDLMVRHATELRLGIDYLETRGDIDLDRLAYIALSFGAGSRLVLAGTDDRFNAVILIGGGIDERMQPTLPEASNINFAPYIRPPKLLINGSTDDEHPWLTRGLPLWNLLREPKTLELIEGAGHLPPLEARIPPINRFLDQVFGTVMFSTGG